MQDHKSDKESGQESSVEVQVTLLDGGQENICISERCLGQELFALVTKKIGVFEYEYFGLLYCDFEGNKCWIDNNKPLTKALRNSSTRPLEFLFAVKFFTPYPNLLEDDLTRYYMHCRSEMTSFRVYCTATVTLVFFWQHSLHNLNWVIFRRQNADLTPI
ncbi:unnamed protein product [Heterobilharzia americana]|nr:unnamed protein product [Heterobilharzia americana]